MSLVRVRQVTSLNSVLVGKERHVHERSTRHSETLFMLVKMTKSTDNLTEVTVSTMYFGYSMSSKYTQNPYIYIYIYIYIYMYITQREIEIE